MLLTPVHASQESDNAREQAEKILTHPRYGKESDIPLEDRINQLDRWLGSKDQDIETRQREEREQIEEQYNPPPEVSPPNFSGLSGIVQVLLYVLIVSIVIAIGYVMFLIIKNRRSKDKSDKDKEDEIEIVDLEDIDWEDEETVLEAITDAEKLERLSTEAENAGRLDIALRYRYRAGLLRLNDKGTIHFNKSFTNAQWQLEISDARFDDVTGDFNDITYGGYTPSRELLEKSKSKWKELLGSR